VTRRATLEVQAPAGVRGGRHGSNMRRRGRKLGGAEAAHEDEPPSGREDDQHSNSAECTSSCGSFAPSRFHQHA
jgi:hypothetical protein